MKDNQPSTPSPDAAGPTPTDNRVYHCICEADGKGHLPACVLSNTTATSAIPIVAASPEGSAGLDAEKKKVLAAIIGGGISAPDEHGVRVICLGYHPEQDEYEWLRVVPESSLIDASRERDRLKLQVESIMRDREAVEERVSAWLNNLRAVMSGQSYVSPTGESIVGAAIDRLAQLTDARSRISELEAAAASPVVEAAREIERQQLIEQARDGASAVETFRYQRDFNFNLFCNALAEAEQLRRSREQAITAIKVLPWGLWCQYLKVGNLDEIKGAVLAILRGAE